jgi:hypothetical protein
MKVADLEHDLGTATAYLATTGYQFSRSPISFKRYPRRRRGCVRATPIYQRTSRVSRANAFFLHPLRCLLLDEP